MRFLILVGLLLYHTTASSLECETDAAFPVDNLELGHLKLFPDVSSLNLSCPEKKTTISRTDWVPLEKKFMSESSFRNNVPEGDCSERLVALRYELFKLGYHFGRKILIEGDILAIANREVGSKGFFYRYHVAQIISIKEENGVDRDYVFDPMFSESLMSVEDFVKSLDPGLKDGDANFKPLSYKIIEEVNYLPNVFESKSSKDLCTLIALGEESEVMEMSKSNHLPSDTEREGQAPVGFFSTRKAARSIYLKKFWDVTDANFSSALKEQEVQVNKLCEFNKPSYSNDDTSSPIRPGRATTTRDPLCSKIQTSEKGRNF